jgi:hypothetical protein
MSKPDPNHYPEYFMKKFEKFAHMKYSGYTIRMK